MKSSSWFAQALIAIILVAAGAILWRSSEHERRLAAAERDLVTLKYDDAAAAAEQPGGRLAGLMPGARTEADSKTLASTAGYWGGDYDKAIENPDAKLLAANAAYRKLRQTGGSWQAVVGRMDSVVKQYAEILREDPANTEAAFNYEYVVRLRAVIAARKLPVAPVDGHERQHFHSRLRRRAAGSVRHEEVQDDRADAARRAPRSREGRQGHDRRCERASTASRP